MATELKSFDRVADCYDATRALPPAAEAAVASGIMRALRQVRARPTVLEVGIGTGRIAVPLMLAGAHVVGVDIAPAMLARLRAKRQDIFVVIAEATRLPFPADSFDGALFVHLLHLLRDAGAALRAATRVVRPGGVLLYGRTHHSESLLRSLAAEARRLARGLSGAELCADDWHAEADRAFTVHARELGGELTDVTLAHWWEQATGRGVLAALGRRIYSSSWEIPEALMPELLRRLTVWIEEQVGDLDRVIETEVTFTLKTVQLPR